jgi:hypothetical protein
LTSADLVGVLAEACARVGLDDRAAQPLRVGTNALFRIDRRSVVVRIGLRPDAVRIAEKEIRVAEWLVAEGVPAVRPVAGIAQPVNVGGRPVTFWEWVPADEDRPAPRQLGAALRRVHALPVPLFELPYFDPLAGVDALLTSDPAVDPDALSFLRNECERLRRAYHQLTFELPWGPVHGDAHTGNLMRSDGRAILIDFETFAVGPREWDLVPTAVQLERFGLPAGEYRAFAEAYGVDVRARVVYPVLRRIRELTITAWLLGGAARQRGAAEEFAARVAALRGAHDGRVWQRY